VVLVTGSEVPLCLLPLEQDHSPTWRSSARPAPLRPGSAFWIMTACRLDGGTEHLDDSGTHPQPPPVIVDRHASIARTSADRGVYTYRTDSKRPRRAAGRREL